MQRYFEIEDACYYGTKIKEVWIKSSKDKILFNCFTDEALELAIKALENEGFINATNKNFTDFNLEK